MANPLISIVIPIYEMQGEGVEYLARCLDSIESQTIKDYEIVIVDSSKSDELWASLHGRKTNKIVYLKSMDSGASINTNKGIDQAKGYFIKILHQDDFFAHSKAIEMIVNDKGWNNHDWLVTGCIHTHGKDRFNERKASWSSNVVLENLIGAPSVVTIKNTVKTRFRTDLKWIFDGVFYKELGDTYGYPVFLDDTNVVICVGKHQATNILTNQEKENEINRYVQGIV
jgi:glycosyltransferase involved in cell wall biosynthesis